MSILSTITVPDGTEYELVPKRTRGFYRGVTDDASTNKNFIVTIDGITELYDGLAILVKNTKVASASGFVINVNNLGGKSVWSSYKNSVTTTGFALNTEWLLYYDELNDRWVKYEGLYAANSNTIGEYGGVVVAGSNGMARYSLAMKTSDTEWESVVLTSSPSTSKSKNSKGFLLNDTIMLYQSGSTIAAGGKSVNSTTWISAHTADTRYSFNVSSSWSVSGRPLFLVGTINENDGKFYLNETKWWSDAYPISEDGYYYVYVGQMTSAYVYTMHAMHPIFYYKDGKVLQFSNKTVKNASMVNVSLTVDNKKLTVT